MKNNISSNVEKSLIQKYPLAAFFVMAYVFFLFSLLVIGGIRSSFTVSPFMMNVFVVIASWTPNAAALIVVGAVGFRKLLAGWLDWRVHPGWYLFGLAPLIIALAVGASSIALGNPAPTATTGVSGTALLLMLIFNLLQGATGEELGWRGFALPSLQARYSKLVSALILGLLIAGWHSILHIFSPPVVPEWQFWLTIVCYSIVVAWAYNRMGSLLIVTLFHFSFNFGLDFVANGLGWTSVQTIFTSFTIAYLLWALVIIVGEGKKIWQKPAVETER